VAYLKTLYLEDAFLQSKEVWGAIFFKIFSPNWLSGVLVEKSDFGALAKP
jgi:hypothetical protein